MEKLFFIFAYAALFASFAFESVIEENEVRGEQPAL